MTVAFVATLTATAKDLPYPYGTTHDFYWTELRANNRGHDYFSHYYGVDWTPYLDAYPLHKHSF